MGHWKSHVVHPPTAPPPAPEISTVNCRNIFNIFWFKSFPASSQSHFVASEGLLKAHRYNWQDFEFRNAPTSNFFKNFFLFKRVIVRLCQWLRLQYNRWQVSELACSTGGLILTGKTDVLQEKPVPVPLYSPTILQGLSRDWTRTTAVTGRRLTAYVRTRKFFLRLSSISSCRHVFMATIQHFSTLFNAYSLTSSTGGFYIHKLFE